MPETKQKNSSISSLYSDATPDEKIDFLMSFPGNLFRGDGLYIIEDGRKRRTEEGHRGFWCDEENDEKEENASARYIDAVLESALERGRHDFVERYISDRNSNYDSENFFMEVDIETAAAEKNVRLVRYLVEKERRENSENFIEKLTKSLETTLHQARDNNFGVVGCKKFYDARMRNDCEARGVVSRFYGYSEERNSEITKTIVDILIENGAVVTSWALLYACMKRPRYVPKLFEAAFRGGGADACAALLDSDVGMARFCECDEEEGWSKPGVDSKVYKEGVFRSMLLECGDGFFVPHEGCSESPVELFAKYDRDMTARKVWKHKVYGDSEAELGYGRHSFGENEEWNMTTAALCAAKLRSHQAPEELASLSNALRTLIEKGANVNHECRPGRTMLFFVFEAMHDAGDCRESLNILRGVADYLIEKGALLYSMERLDSVPTDIDSGEMRNTYEAYLEEKLRMLAGFGDNIPPELEPLSAALILSAPDSDAPVKCLARAVECGKIDAESPYFKAVERWAELYFSDEDSRKNVFEVWEKDAVEYAKRCETKLSDAGGADLFEEMPAL